MHICKEEYNKKPHTYAGDDDDEKERKKIIIKNIKNKKKKKKADLLMCTFCTTQLAEATLATCISFLNIIIHAHREREREREFSELGARDNARVHFASLFFSTTIRKR